MPRIRPLQWARSAPTRIVDLCSQAAFVAHDCPVFYDVTLGMAVARGVGMIRPWEKHSILAIGLAALLVSGCAPDSSGDEEVDEEEEVDSDEDALSVAFQLPFPCGQVWSGQSRTNHSPQLSVDFNRTDDVNDTVVAAAAGTVTRVGNEGNDSYGRWIEIDHGNGYRTRYAHLNTQTVSQGQFVAPGTEDRYGRQHRRLDRSPPALRTATERRRAERHVQQQLRSSSGPRTTRATTRAAGGGGGVAGRGQHERCATLTVRAGASVSTRPRWARSPTGRQSPSSARSRARR